jgi:hypothetical protein
MYQLREKVLQQDSSRFYSIYSPSPQRRDSIDMMTPTDFRKTVLDYSSPILEPDRKNSLDEDRKQSKDPKFAYGYFVNRSRYHKQSNPTFGLEIIGTKQVEKDREIRDIKINKAQTIIYVLLSDGTTRFL